MSKCVKVESATEYGLLGSADGVLNQLFVQIMADEVGKIGNGNQPNQMRKSNYFKRWLNKSKYSGSHLTVTVTLA